MGDETSFPDDLRRRRNDSRKWWSDKRILGDEELSYNHYHRICIRRKAPKKSVKLQADEAVSASGKHKGLADDVEMKTDKEEKIVKKLKKDLPVKIPEVSSNKKLKTGHRLGSGINMPSIKGPILFGLTSIKPYCFKWPGIYVPKWFAIANGLFNRSCDMELVDEEGDHWPVKLWPKPYDGQVYIKQGWSDFQRAHGLTIGDEIRFECISGGEKPILKCSIRQLGSTGAVGVTNDCQPLVQRQALHAKSSGTAPQSVQSARIAEKIWNSEKIAQQCHGLSATVSDGGHGKEMVTGEIIMGSSSSLPIVDLKPCDENLSQANCSRNELMDEICGKPVLKEVIPVANSEHPATPEKSPTQLACKDDACCSFPLASLQHRGCQSKAPALKCSMEVGKTSSPGTICAIWVLNSPVDDPRERVEHADGQIKAPTSQFIMEVLKMISAGAKVIWVHNSPPDDHPREKVEHIDGQIKAPTAQFIMEIVKTICPGTTSAVWVLNPPADDPEERVESVGGQIKDPTSQCSMKVDKIISPETPSADGVCNTSADSPREQVEPADGQNDALTTQCSMVVEKTISTEAPSAIWVCTSPAPTERVEPVDGQNKAPTTHCSIEAEKISTSTMLYTPSALTPYEHLIQNSVKRMEPMRNTSTLSSMVEAIISRHGDISKGCTLKSGILKSAVLHGICTVVQKLHNTKPTDIQSTQLEEFYLALQDVEYLKCDVDWLRQTLDEISKQKELIKISDALKDEEKKRARKAGSFKMILLSRRGKLEKLRRKMKRLESEIRVSEHELESENSWIEKLRIMIEDIKSTTQQSIRVI